MITPMLPNLIVSMKIIYSEEIINQIKEDKRKYFFEVLNSIPDDLFEGTNNPHKLIKNGKKLSGFLHTFNEELRAEGMDMTNLEKNLKENNEKYKEMITPKLGTLRLRELFK